MKGHEKSRGIMSGVQHPVCMSRNKQNTRVESRGGTLNIAEEENFAEEGEGEKKVASEVVSE